MRGQSRDGMAMDLGFSPPGTVTVQRACPLGPARWGLFAAVSIPLQVLCLLLVMF